MDRNFYLFLCIAIVACVGVFFLTDIEPKYKVVGSNYRCKICEASDNRAEMYKKFYEECLNSKDTITIRDTIETGGWIILDTLDSVTVKWGGYLLPKGYSHKISLDTALIETLNVNNLTPADFDSALEALK